MISPPQEPFEGPVQKVEDFEKRITSRKEKRGKGKEVD